MNNKIFNAESIKNNKEFFKQYIESKMNSNSKSKMDSNSEIEHNSDLQVIQRFDKEIVSIDSRFRDTLEYPNSNNFKSYLGKSFKNVIKIKLISTQIPNVEQVIKELPVEIQNNLISWQNKEDYNLGIRINCIFEYIPDDKVINITVPEHGLTIGSNIIVYLSNCSLSVINLVGNREVRVIDSSTIQLDYNTITNYTGTITVDLGPPIYTISITPGSYNSTSLASEIQTKMNEVLRENGDYHYFVVEVNNKTDIFTFSNYSIQKLLPNSISVTLGSNTIVLTHINHGFKDGESIYIEGIPKIGGIPTDLINGIFTVKNATLDTLEYTITTNASITTTGGSNSVIIGKNLPFRFLFDTENTLIQYNIGFPNEDSSEYIGTINPIITNVVSISNIQNNIPANFSTITTTTPHLLKGATFFKINSITTNGNPVYLTTDISHYIESEIQVTLSGFDTIPNINTTYTIKPITENTVQIINDTLNITTDNTNYNNTFMIYYNDSIDLIDLIATPYNSTYNSLKSIQVNSIISPYSFTIQLPFRYIDTNSISNAKVGTSKIKLQHTSHPFNNSIEMYSNEGIPTYSGTSTNYDSINIKSATNISYENTLRTDSILLENNDSTLASSSRNIIGITNPSTGIIEFELNSHYYYTVGETITISGTNALDGTYTIYSVSSLSPPSPAPYNLYEMNYIQIQTSITDTSFIGIPTIAPAFHSTNTVRIIDYHHSLITNNTISLLDISNTSNTPSLQEYLIYKLSNYSYLIKFTHSIAVPLSICTIQHKLDILTVSDTRYISPQLNGEYNFFNKFPLENITGQINLGRNTYISTINMPITGYYNDIVTNSDGSNIATIVNTYPLLKPYYIGINPNEFQVIYSLILYSNNSGNNFIDKTPDSIYSVNNGDTITVISGGNSPLNDNTDYTILNKLSPHSFTLQYNHNSAITSDNITIRNQYSDNIDINSIVIENDPLLTQTEFDILNVLDLSPDYTGGACEITIDGTYPFIDGEQIQIIGGTTFDGTYTVYQFDYQITQDSLMYKNTLVIVGAYDISVFTGGKVKISNTTSNTVKVISSYMTNISRPSKKLRMGTNDTILCYFINKPYSNTYYFTESGGNTWTYYTHPTNYTSILNINSLGDKISLLVQDIPGFNKYIYTKNNDTFYLVKTITTASNTTPQFSISNTGQYQVVVVFNEVYISNDYGISYTTTTIPGVYYDNITEKGIIMSENGKYIYILFSTNPPGNYQLYYSHDYGITFNAGILLTSSYYNITTDSSGRYVIISRYFDDGINPYFIFYSEDYGVNFTYNNINPLVFDNTTSSIIDLSKNGKIFYTITTNTSSNIIYKWDTTSQELTFKTESDLNYFVQNDTITIQNNSDSFINGTYTINEIVSSSEFKITPNVLIVPNTYTNYGTVTNNSRLNVILDSNTFTITGIRTVLIENDSSNTFNISSIAQYSTGIIKITLSSSTYLNIEEEITISGTNSLDDTYTIYNIDYNLIPGYPITSFYLQTNQTDLTYSGTPIVTPNFYNSNTMRLVIPNHNLTDDTILIYISNNNGSVIPIGYYTINSILSSNSVLIDYTHSPTITTNTIYTQINENLGNLQKNNKFILYRVESTTITGKKSSSIGGLSVNLFNNQEYSIEKIIDSNNYIFDCQGISTIQETTGGNNVYITSLLNGIRNQQLNTYDGISNTKLYRSISLEGYNYLYLCTNGNETKLDTLHTNSNTKNIFAKILLDQPTGHMCFNSYISAEKIFYTPIPELSELTFSMITPDGYLFNFNDTDYSFDLEVTTVYEELENNDTITTKKRIDFNNLK